MTKKEFLKLQIGMFITDNKDTLDPSNYCAIVGFQGTKLRLQPYERYGVPTNDHPFLESYENITITDKLYPSEYYSLSRM